MRRLVRAGRVGATATVVIAGSIFLFPQCNRIISDTGNSSGVLVKQFSSSPGGDAKSRGILQQRVDQLGKPLGQEPGDLLNNTVESTPNISHPDDLKPVFRNHADEPVATRVRHKPSKRTYAKISEGLSAGQVSARLTSNEESYIIDRGKGVERFDLCNLASNNPIEDNHGERVVQAPSKLPGKSADWMFWGVYDGHGGWATSSKLSQELVDHTIDVLSQSMSKGDMDVDSAIKRAFVSFDNELVFGKVNKLLSHPSSKAEAPSVLVPALSGSCALLAFYDTDSQLLKVATTGDSRAVLGSRGSFGSWHATALSEDQTGRNPKEAARLRSLHPDEPDVVRNGRVLGGLEPTRAFGDARYKWSDAIKRQVSELFLDLRRSAIFKTPPYVTAEPVITTTKINPKNGDFVVLATDGLYEMLTNEQIVSLVVQWMERKRPTRAGSPSVWNTLLGSPKVDETCEVAGAKEAFRRPQPVRFVVEDENAATHLIRNALGGADREQVSLLLSLPYPISRRYRDDLTATVIFFGSQGPPNDSGLIRVNPNATRIPASKL